MRNWLQMFLLQHGLDLRFPNARFAFLLCFFFFFEPKYFTFPVNSARCALFTNPQILLFSNFFIKNRSHDTIHTFKNYFTTVFFSFQFQFSISVFSFQLYPNGPLMWCRYHIFVRPQFAWQTPKIPKILTSFHGAVETSRLTLHTLFGYRSTQSSISCQIDQNTLGQPWVDHKSKLVKIIPKQHFSCFYIKPKLLSDSR